jgi:hypothetical protein
MWVPEMKPTGMKQVTGQAVTQIGEGAGVESLASPSVKRRSQVTVLYEEIYRDGAAKVRFVLVLSLNLRFGVPPKRGQIGTQSMAYSGL